MHPLEHLQQRPAAAHSPRTVYSAPLSSQEREGINAGAWFASLSPMLRHDIIRCASVKRYTSGEQIAARADVCSRWIACAKGTVRVGLATLNGKQVTLDYIAPGQWLGDGLMLHEEAHPHDLHAQGDTTTLQIARRDFQALFYTHEEFRLALLRKQCAQAQLLYDKVDDLKTLGLGERLAKALLDLTHKHGVPCEDGLRMHLQLPQRELADLVGASRQRVNEHLKRMEQKNIIRQGVGGLVVRDRAALQAWAHTITVES